MEPLCKVEQQYLHSEEEKSTQDSLSLKSLSSHNSADHHRKMKFMKSPKLTTLMEEVSELSNEIQSDESP